MKEKQVLPPLILPMIILIFLFGSSCGLLSGGDEKKVGDELMPLSAGNYWEYDFAYLGSI